MKKHELLKMIKSVAEEKGIRLNNMNLLSVNKNGLENILNCFNLSKEEMTKHFNLFKIEYPNSAEQLKNNFLYYGWGRYYIYTLTKIDKVVA